MSKNQAEATPIKDRKGSKEQSKPCISVVVHNSKEKTSKPDPANLETLLKFVKEIHDPQAVPEIIAVKYLKIYDKNIKFILFFLSRRSSKFTVF